LKGVIKGKTGLGEKKAGGDKKLSSAGKDGGGG